MWFDAYSAIKLFSPNFPSRGFEVEGAVQPVGEGGVPPPQPVAALGVVSGQRAQLPVRGAPSTETERLPFRKVYSNGQSNFISLDLIIQNRRRGYILCTFYF